MRILLSGLILSTLLAGPALAQDVAAGETVFRKCMSCHAIGEGAANKVGPELNALIGRVAGSHPDYNYSKAMVEAGTGGLVWTAETLAPFLTKPRDYVKGTKMSFAGLSNPDDVANVIAYLATFSPDAAAAPAAAPAAQ